MADESPRKFVLVTRKTRLQELVERFNTWPQAKFYLEHNQVDAKDYLDEHDLYQVRVRQAEQFLKKNGLFQKLERTMLPGYRFHPTDIVVVIGQDGLVANTLKYLDGQPVVALNPDPGRWDGKLLPFSVEDLPGVVRQVRHNDWACRTITFAQAATNDGQHILAVNDLFIGPRTHQSARYRINWADKSETQSSSGIIVSTGFGSTGWFQSILAGAMAVSGTSGHPLENGFAWDEQRLRFSVREPFPSRTTGISLVFGEITHEKWLEIESMMPENGVIFSDGIENDSITFNSGTIAQIGLSKKAGLLVWKR
nr:sugar kinase [uncultured Desulfobacter sp.]